MVMKVQNQELCFHCGNVDVPITYITFVINQCGNVDVPITCITFVVNQCASFMHKPKRIHEQAIKQIGRYLIGTVLDSMIIKHELTLILDCFVDADFAGLWNYEQQRFFSHEKS